jgi:hypothetical protein
MDNLFPGLVFPIFNFHLICILCLTKIDFRLDYEPEWRLSGMIGLRKCYLAAVVTVVLLWFLGGAAFADITPVNFSGGQESAIAFTPIAPISPVAAPENRNSPAGNRNGLSQCPWTQPASSGLAVPVVSREGDAPALPPGEQVRTLPPDPGGAWWIMVSFGCLGAAKAGQYARSPHHLHIPDWYHTGAPARIGHRTLFDFEFSSPTVCTRDTLPGEQALRLSFLPESPSIPAPQFLLCFEGPRAPPALPPCPEL